MGRKCPSFLLLCEKVRKSLLMKRAVLLAIFTVISTVAMLAQSRPLPNFTAYPAAVERPRVRSIDFNKNPDARSLHTRLTAGLRSGVNFAGHYVLVGWGCGTGCISGAIIDARTGNVIWPEQLSGIGVYYAGDSYADEPVAYKKNSRLLVITGSPGVLKNAPEKPAGIYYYEWERERFRLVKFVKKDVVE